MALQVSTGFKSKILGPFSFESIFNGGCIEFRSGTQPATADDAETGLLLARVTLNGLPWVSGSPTNGLSFVRVGPYVTKNPADAWLFTTISSGVATWFRLKPSTYDGGERSFTAARIDGDVGTGAGAVIRLFNNVLDAGETNSLDYFMYTIPPISGE